MRKVRWNDGLCLNFMRALNFIRHILCNGLVYETQVDCPITSTIWFCNDVVVLAYSHKIVRVLSAEVLICVHEVLFSCLNCNVIFFLAVETVEILLRA